jgi:hypothetical protein
MMRLLTRSFEAAAPCAGYRIVAFVDAANSNKIGHATSATQPLAGTTGKFGGPAASMVDVELLGVVPVQLGGTVGAGDPLTANASAKAIKATVAGQRIIGFAQRPGVLDDIINYMAAPGVLGA